MEFIKDIISILGTVVGLSIAGVGLSTWRKQLKGRTEYDLARRLLKATYRVREGIRRVRHPLMTGGEMAEAAEKYDIDEPQENRTKVSEAAYAERWKELTDPLNDLKLESLEAEALWGKSINEALEPLYSCIGELKASIWHYHWLESRGDMNKEENQKNYDKAFEVIFEVSNDPEKDTFTGNVEKAIKKIESVAKPHLQI